MLISHYHGDHINGLRKRDGSWTFANAKVYVPSAEHAYWMDDAKMAAAPESLKGAFQTARRVFAGMPADKLVRFEPGAAVIPGIAPIAAFGHTLFETTSAGQTFAYLADLTNVPTLCKALVGGFQFPFPAFGRKTPAGDGYAFQAVA